MNSQREAFEQWWIDLALTSDTPHWFTHDGKEAARAAWQAATEQGVGEAGYSVEVDLEETQKTLSAAEAKIEEYEGFFTGEDGDNHGGDAKAIINDYLRTHPPKPTGGGVPEPNLKWSKNQPPNNECSYDHCTAETPFGRFLITWKSWKEDPEPTVDETPWGSWWDVFDTVEEAQEGCETEYGRRLLATQQPPEWDTPE